MNTNEIIKSLRQQKKMSQDQLAKLTGYSDRSSIAKIESGIVDLPESKIKLFAEVLEVAPAQLMGYASLPLSTTFELTSEEVQLLNDYRGASDEIREEAAAMLHRSAERIRKDRT